MTQLAHYNVLQLLEETRFLLLLAVSKLTRPVCSVRRDLLLAIKLGLLCKGLTKKAWFGIVQKHVGLDEMILWFIGLFVHRSNWVLKTSLVLDCFVIWWLNPILTTTGRWGDRPAYLPQEFFCLFYLLLVRLRKQFFWFNVMAVQ